MGSKVIIVTGASRGIGLAVCDYLLQKPQSSKLVIVARGKQQLEDIKSQYPNDQVQVLAGDLTDYSLGKKAVDLALSKWGKLDGMVLNHGTLGPVDRIANNDPNDWRTCFETNLFSSIAFITAALPSLRTSKGKIVLTSSGAASKHFTGWGAYGCSKAAIEHLAMALPIEEPNVTTVSVKPGVVNTEMQKQVRSTHAATQDPNDVELFKSLYEKGALLQPHQPGNVLARLVLDCPKELSGQCLTWDDDSLQAFQDTKVKNGHQ